MSAVHLHRLDGRILLCPASDAVLRSCVRTYIPVQYLRIHPYLDGWELPSIFQRLVLRVVEASHGLASVCPSCWSGSPCQPWIDGVQARFAEGRALHSLAWQIAWDAAERARIDAERPDHDGPRAKRRRADATILDAANILGVDWPCDATEVHAAFKRLALETHPDHGGSERAMVRLIDARKTLAAALGDR